LPIFSLLFSLFPISNELANIYGFGDTSAATENMLFYNGKTHKLSNVYWHIPLNEKGKEEYLKPWSFTSDDGRFEMEFQPILDRAACINALVLKSD
jgi:hypothetical protein